MKATMTVNAFWFGFLVAIVVLLVLVMVTAMIRAYQDDDGGEEIELDEEEYRELLEEKYGKKFRVFRKHGYLVAEPLDDEEDDADDKAQ